jgi:hypothetical protein
MQTFLVILRTTTKERGRTTQVGLVSTTRLDGLERAPSKGQRGADALDRLDKVRVEAVAELGDAGGDLVEPGDER